MFGSNKRSLTIALSVVFLLSMLAPAAMAAPAAPEWVHGAAIISPTTGAPAYVENESEGVDIPVEFSITIVGTQMCDVNARFELTGQDGETEYAKTFEIEKADLNGCPGGVCEFLNPPGDLDDPLDPVWVLDNVDLDDGWYDLTLFAIETTENNCEEDWQFTAWQKKALLLDEVEPEAELAKPGDDEYLGAAFITGQHYLMVGEASDKWGVKAGEFELCKEGFECMFDWAADDWVKIGVGTPTTPVPNADPQWQANWDSTMVPDGFYFMRFCAYDLVGNTNCEPPDNVNIDRSQPLVTPDGLHQNPWPDAHWVFVDNRWEMDLQPGWNLISTPIAPYDPKIESVLSHLIAHNSVAGVWTRVYEGGAWVWKMWQPPVANGVQAANTLTEIVDGQGYWILMKASSELIFVGSWKSHPTMGPPEYPVFDGWNLIGYTQWGKPTWFDPKDMQEYLGGDAENTVWKSAAALWAYDAFSETFFDLEAEDDMLAGYGYWLAVTQDGTIYP